MKKRNVPKQFKDLKVKIGSVEEAAWKEIFERSTVALAQGKREQVINDTIMSLARKKMKEEHSVGSSTVESADSREV